MGPHKDAIYKTPAINYDGELCNNSWWLLAVNYYTKALNLRPRYTSTTPTIHLYYTNDTPLLHQRYTCTTPTIHLYYTNDTPLLHQRYTSARPTIHLCDTNDSHNHVKFTTKIEHTFRSLLWLSCRCWFRTIKKYWIF